MRIVAPFGFYGAGNIGDEATLQGFARVVACSKPKPLVHIGSRNVSHTRRVEPAFRYFPVDRRPWQRRLINTLASAYVVAGGTPIMDSLGAWPLCELTPLVEAGHQRGRPFTFVGIGTERLERPESRRIVRDTLSRYVQRWTVRSERDLSRLTEYGVPPDRVTVAADMAWLLEPVDPAWGRGRLRDWGVPEGRPLIGVNLLGETAVLQREPRLFEKVAQWLDHLLTRDDAFVVFLANEVRDGETFDTAAARRTQALMRHAALTLVAPNEYLAPQQMLSIVANCRCTVSMRYHFCLFSALQRVPFVALQRSDKVKDLCADLEWPFGRPLGGLQVVELIDLFERLERERADSVAGLAARVTALGIAAGRNQLALHHVADLDSGAALAPLPAPR